MLRRQSTVSKRKALIRLQEVGAVRLLKHDARRGRIWVADELLGMLNAFEWESLLALFSGQLAIKRGQADAEEQCCLFFVALALLQDFLQVSLFLLAEVSLQRSRLIERLFRGRARAN